MPISDKIATEYTNTRTQEDLVNVLLNNHESPLVVIDVRINTHYPVDGRFRPENLEPVLDANDIEYYYHQRLGNKFKKEKDAKVSEEKYVNDVKNSRKFKELLERIEKEDKNFILLCYCTPPKPCHRRWLRKALINAHQEKTKNNE